MLERDQLPENAGDWGDVIVDFPRLDENSAKSCPLSEDDIFDYVQCESADLEQSARTRFLFLRTAQVEDKAFWLWTYTEVHGEATYVWVRGSSTGDTLLSLNSTFGLSPEQFILAAYYDEVDWS